ncbi:BTB/Kelch-associated,BTB-kelch protein,BTB/POZ domain,Kelch-type beta propeller,Kelch repeat type [Cinara cedri]|uniref:BTB/Kelch-associated,BTB-kelch protein,BTB/POZ domain,Kelch-type beta propeller,Kelch repeat type n=2 Tax=Cinara cedri TaxID=506608 RepID=A0A5E4NGU9_9HEMI|nr:BTB/Kelch-associated,BTB-kelch protein,BTB/POZ domain,Kelch-type beta propeller,Kelch repeat type [Cinara cedri]
MASTSSGPWSPSTSQKLEETAIAEEPPTCESPEPMSCYLHHDPDHPMSSFSVINKMRVNIQLCDVSLRVGNSVTKAHRLVLASSSPYFYAMFNDDMAEKLQSEVELHDVDLSALQLLIEYSYTGQVHITDENVQVLLPASSLLQINSVRDACCLFLMKQLHATNCLGIRQFAETHSCNELRNRSHRYALQNFEEVMKTEEFLFLTYSEVEDLISNDKLNVVSEEQVFVAVVDWIKHNQSERSQYIAKLLGHVRLAQMSKMFLLNVVETEPLVRSEPSCKDLLLGAMKYHLLPDQRSDFASKQTEQRRPDGLMPYIFAIGGGSLFTIHSAGECYNPRHDRWLPIAPMSKCRSRAGIVSLGKLIYAIGGYDGIVDLSSAECYDPNYNRWSAVTSLGTKRSCLGISASHGLLYVCGGFDGASCLSSVERYDPLTGVWSSCPSMTTRRRYCRVSVVDNCLYALGGFDSTNYQSTVERYDPRMSKWTTVPAMSSRRSSCAVATLDDMLYCVGGNDGTMCMSSGERLNVRRNAWEPIATMQCRRATHDMVELDGGLLVLGGNDSNSSLHSTERYDPRINRWTMSTPMPTRRSSVGAALLYCFNMDTKLTNADGGMTAMAVAAGNVQSAVLGGVGQCGSSGVTVVTSGTSSVTHSPFKSTATSV